ncbi:hypothetical protein ACET3Z_028180 [Daucus carota]
MFLLERIPFLRKEFLNLSEYEETKSTQFPSALHWSKLMTMVSSNMRSTINWKSLLDQVQSRTDPTIGNMKAAFQFVKDVKVIVLPPPPPSPQPHSLQRNDERLEDEEQRGYDDGNRDNKEREHSSPLLNIG